MEENDGYNFGDWFSGIIREGTGTYLNYTSDTDVLLGTDKSKMIEQMVLQYVQQKLDEYNWENYDSPAAMLKWFGEIGVNPNLAVQAILNGNARGIDNGTAPAVPSSASPLSQIAGAVADVGGALGNVGGFTKALTESRQIQQLLPYNKKVLSETAAELQTKAGVNRWTALAISEKLPYETAEMKADIYCKYATYDKTLQEYKNLKAQHNNILAEYDAIIARKDVDVSQKDYLDALKGKVDEETRQLKQDNDFFEIRGYRPNSPNDIALRSAIERGDENGANVIGDAIESAGNRNAAGNYRAQAEYAYKIAYDSMSGQERAIVENAYKKRVEELKAEYQGQIRYANRLAQIEANRERIVGMAKIYSKDVDGVNGFLGWFMQALIKCPADIFNQMFPNQ